MYSKAIYFLSCVQSRLWPHFITHHTTLCMYQNKPTFLQWTKYWPNPSVHVLRYPKKREILSVHQTGQTIKPLVLYLYLSCVMSGSENMASHSQYFQSSGFMSYRISRLQLVSAKARSPARTGITLDSRYWPTARLEIWNNIVWVRRNPE